MKNIKSIQLKKPVVIGLTGGPGVGKTEAAKIFEKKGVKVISADLLGHEILENNESIRQKLLKLFGDCVLTRDGNFDRKKIGDIVFNDEDIMMSFNQIIHPVLVKDLKKLLHQAKNNSRFPMIVVDAALIFEWGIADWFDYIMVITSLRKLRLKRIYQSGISLNQAKKRIASQFPQRIKIGLADYVIENNSTRVVLAKKIGRFVASLKKLNT